MLTMPLLRFRLSANVSCRFFLFLFLFCFWLVVPDVAATTYIRERKNATFRLGRQERRLYTKSRMQLRSWAGLICDFFFPTFCHSRVVKILNIHSLFMLMHASLTLWQILFTHIFTFTDRHIRKYETCIRGTLYYIQHEPELHPLFHFRTLQKRIKAFENWIGKSQKNSFQNDSPRLLLYEVV